MGILLWIYIVYEAFAVKRVSEGNPWVHQELFTNVNDTEVVNTLEWTQESPPAFHTYNELPYLVHSTK